MCATYIYTFVVSIIEGLVDGVLHYYRLNDKKNSTTLNQADTTDNTNIEHHQCKGTFKTSATEQHPDHCYLKYNEDDNHQDPYLLSDTQQDPLFDFGLRYHGDDMIYEEFIPNDNNHDRLAWRLSRPSAYSWFCECVKTSFYITVLSGFFIGAATVFLMSIDINTADVCSTSKWKEIPVNVQRVVVVAQTITCWTIQWLHFFTMYCIFGWSLIRDLHLMSWIICAAFIDTMYRLCLQIFNLYGIQWKTFPLNVLFVLATIINSYKIANHFYHKMSRKVILTFQLGAQYSLGTIAISGVIYLLVPLFIHSSPSEQAIIAAGTPLVGAIPKLVSRLAAQKLTGINHPGTSYVLVISTYTSSTILARVMQANIESLDLYVLLCFGHGIVGLLERLSVVARDHFYIWFYKKVLKRENFQCYIGKYRTPRTQRLVADITICTMLLETMAVILSNVCVQLYEFNFGTKEIVGKLNVKQVFYKLFLRIIISIGIEFVCGVFGIFLATWYQNIPLVRVWKKKWNSLLLVNLLMCSFFVLYCTQCLVPVLDEKYKRTFHINQTTKCIFFGNIV